MTALPRDFRFEVIAVILSLPSCLGVFVFAIAKVAEALGSNILQHNEIVGALVLISLVLIPIASAILVAWAIAWWANHGSVPGWLIATAIGNALVFYVFYQMTTM